MPTRRARSERHFAARKIGTTLRRIVPDLPRVDGAILLTQEPSKLRRIAKREVRGVQLHTLNDCKGALGLEMPCALSPLQVVKLSRALEPKSAAAKDGSLRRLAGYVNLELQTPKEDHFHRIYKGSHSARRDRVVLHLYDLSASDDKNAETKAKREFEALHRLQLRAWAPRIMDSYQEAPGYAGEMSFFTVVDPAAPCIGERASDITWGTTSRLDFAHSTVRALVELHEAGTADDPMVHRNLTPSTILVRHDNSPILTGFDRAKIPSNISVASSRALAGEGDTVVAPEVRAQGLGAADHRSDVYSLCASLAALFHGREDEASQRAMETLTKGLTEEPEERSTLQDLDGALSTLLGESVPPPASPPARFWTEEQVVRFRDRDYRIVARLGSGGVGTTFKVVEIDRSTQEDLGTYVAKVGHNAETGGRVLRAYSLARSHLGRHGALSAIFEVAREWRENDFTALMTWIEGSPLSGFVGVFPLLAEEQQETSSEALAVRWLRAMCEALNVLHRNGLVHGDVSPRNMIVSGSDLVLTDYDFVGKIGEPLAGPGTVLYCSPSYQDHRLASPPDDIYALAASFFHVLFEKEPFQYGGSQAKARGLNWEGIDRAECGILAAFLDKATHPASERRFASVAEAIVALKEQQPDASPTAPAPEAASGAEPGGPSQDVEQAESREERVEWLRSLLQSYPGSRWGNRETRGLDTDFAARTYVETKLEETLHRDIRERRVRLVILCGNAGDGKTALLQHLGRRLGFGEHSSAERILQGRLRDGLVVRMNLDGSAAWRGHSADEILDEFLEPFQKGPPDKDIMYLLAINDGPLLEWIEGVESGQQGEATALFESLQAVHLCGETHITIRELRAALIYIVFGVDACEEYHGQFEISAIRYWDRAFSADSPGRQGDVLRELARFDPAMEAHPQIDRHLLSRPSPDSAKTAPHYDQLSLESARRRAYFEWTEEHIQQVSGDPQALDLARGRHLRLFRNLPLEREPQERANLCARLCAGISRLEDLPPQALDRPGVVPLRITPRTPTETAFWVEKPLAAFRLEADLPREAEAVERLHRQAFLIYRYRDGREERLRLAAELFHLLLELSDGYQLGDVSTDDTFAHLSIFVREDERELFAWNPMRDEAIHRMSIVLDAGPEGAAQKMVLQQIAGGGYS